jgi:sigma-B regulation protein RsbU (phosphoserine phosphatase)
MRILIVDDSLDDRLLLETFLRKAGFSELTLADSAQDSFRQLGLEEPTREVYQVDLVLMDILMPEIDGIEACRRIKASEQFSDVPIIMITAQTEMEYLRSAFDAGAIDYITKPVNKVELLARVSSALTLKREMDQRKAREQEIIDIGSEIQQTLLQGHPPQDLPGIGVAAFIMQSLRIGGDFYDFFKHNDRCLDIIIGDVMGKGIPAALMGAAIKNQFVRAMNHLIVKEGIGRIPEPEEIVRRVHSELTAELIKLDSFVTLCYARVDLNGSRLSFVDCGHAKSLHFRQATGKQVVLQGENLPLGVSESEYYRQVFLPFEPGDLFVFYSDGVTEMRNEVGEFFGLERLGKFMEENGRLPPEELVRGIRRAVVSFSGTEVFSDDAACVIIKIEGAETDIRLARHDLQISSDLSELLRVRAFVGELFRKIPPSALSEEGRSQLELAVHEAITNIIKHAYHGRPDKLIQMEVELSSEKITFRLCHWGEGFEPGDIEPPDFEDDSRQPGLGLYIIDQVADELRYARDEDGKNCVYLVKNLEVLRGE